MTVVAANISTTKLDTFKCKLNSCYSTAASKVVKASNYYLPCGDEFSCLLKELFLYEIVVNDWQQNSNGTTTGYTNRITLEQLKNIIDRVNTICNSCGC